MTDDSLKTGNSYNHAIRFMTDNGNCVLIRPPGIVDIHATEVFSPQLKITGNCRRALVIALSYPNTNAKLQGVASSVSTMIKALERSGFNKSDIEILSDDRIVASYDPIMKAMQSLIEGAELGDSFFLLICGHWLPYADAHGLRPDRIGFSFIPSFEKESIPMTDHDVYRNVVQPLISGTRLTILLESCTEPGSLNFPFSCSVDRGVTVCTNPWFSSCDARLFSSTLDLHEDCNENSPQFVVGSFVEAFAKALEDKTSLITFLGIDSANSKEGGKLSRTSMFHSTQRIAETTAISLTDILFNTNPLIGQVVELIYTKSPESDEEEQNRHVDRVFKPTHYPINRIIVMRLKSMLQPTTGTGNHSSPVADFSDCHAQYGNHHASTTQTVNYTHHVPYNGSIASNYSGTLLGQHPTLYSLHTPNTACNPGVQNGYGDIGHHRIVPNSQVSAIPAKAVLVSTPPSSEGSHPLSVVGLPSHSVISSRRKERALLIGCNYAGQSSQLNGCINDCINIRDLLISTFHFDSRNIRVMTDDSYRDPPTYHNIIMALQWLVSGASAGDCLFFHFSGHGGQTPDNYGVEEDGFNETILPCDHRERGDISDNQLFQIMVQSLPAGVRLTAVMDCCNSGTGLDLPLTWWPHPGPCFGWREDINPWFTSADVQLFSGCQDGKTAADLRGKYTPACGAMTTSFCNVLRTGPQFSYIELLNALHREMLRVNLKQRPQLSSSQPFGLDRPFSLRDAVPNRNKVLGRIIRKRFTPGTPVRVDNMSDGFHNALANLGKFLR